MTRLRVDASARQAWFGAGGLVTTILAILARDYPWVGHDYRYFIPRLIDTDLHIRLNGLAIQWYTPTFGGGLPAFPNPQHLEYSLVQLMTLVVNPWLAVLITTAIAALVGYVVLYQFARATLGLGQLAATLCALFFVGNGFFIAHMIVGHLGFQLFPLGAVMLSVLVDRRRPALANGAILAIVIALMLHQAGFYLLIILGLSVALTLPMLVVYRATLIDWPRLTGTVAIAFVLAVGLAGGKIYAALQLMRQFPREAADIYPVGLVEAGAGFVAQLTGAMVLAPLFAVVRIDPSRVSGALMHLTGADVRSGVWEVDTGLSPVLLVILLIGLLWFALDIRATGWPAFSRSQKVALAVLAVGVWIAIESTLARGFLYPLLKQLPVISSLHVNHRLAAAFILPLSIVGGLLVDRWHSQLPHPAQAWALVVLTALAPLSYFMLPAQVHLRTFDLSGSIEAARQARSGERFDVGRIVDADDAGALVAHGSSLQPYEPLFGYVNESFKPLVHGGDVREVSDGSFNMTQAASLVFPEANGVRPFDRIPIGQRDALEAFLSRRQPDWKVPAVETWLNRVAVLSVMISGALVLLAFRRRPTSGSR